MGNWFWKDFGLTPREFVSDVRRELRGGGVPPCQHQWEVVPSMTPYPNLEECVKCKRLRKYTALARARVISTEQPYQLRPALLFNF
eukprot:g72637.t1